MGYVLKGDLMKGDVMKGDVLKNADDDELRAIRWDRFWESVWICGAAVGLVVLVSLSRFTVVNELSVAFR
jgi:hypothetical protein